MYNKLLPFKYKFTEFWQRYVPMKPTLASGKNISTTPRHFLCPFHSPTLQSRQSQSSVLSVIIDWSVFSTVLCKIVQYARCIRLLLLSMLTCHSLVLLCLSVSGSFSVIAAWYSIVQINHILSSYLVKDVGFFSAYS